MTDDALYDFLRIGIEDLSRYGIVKGTEAFRSQKVRPVPQVQVGVSVESNLLDITVTSRDVSKEDLL
ncbi:MAG: SNF2 helicase associated domain-containing protein, partial [Lachnospiraceae bacterium]|nr:SNF2 helicase associated domain-containing protein [Lachnospiraceae bacterium]